MEIQTVTVTGNWLDSFIESVTIYSVGEGPCSDVMRYITPPFLALLCVESIFFSFLGLSQLNLLFLIFFWIFSVLEPFVVLEPQTCWTWHSLGLPLEGCFWQYLNTTSLFGSGVFYGWAWAPWLCILCFQSVCPLYLSLSRTCCFETYRRKL